MLASDIQRSPVCLIDSCAGNNINNLQLAGEKIETILACANVRELDSACSYGIGRLIYVTCESIYFSKSLLSV